VPRFQKALTCRVSRRASCVPLARDSRESTVDDTLLCGKANKTGRASGRDGSRWLSRLGRSQISKRCHNSSLQAVAVAVALSLSLSRSLSLSLSLSLFIYLSRYLHLPLRVLTPATNYNVTFRRRERRRCGRVRARDLSRPAYCRDIFSPTANLASSSGRTAAENFSPCKIRL